jgi:putative transposase
MPWGLKRFQQSGQTHFVTFCCYRRRESFADALAKHTFEVALERVRRSFQLCVYGYVVMPEHVHLLISEPREETLADALKSLKQGVSRRLIDGATHFWQKRYYERREDSVQQWNYPTQANTRLEWATRPAHPPCPPADLGETTSTLNS